MGKTPWISRLVIATVVVAAVVGSIVLFNRDGESPAAATHGDGLIETHDGFNLEPVTLPQKRGESTPVAFRIRDKHNRPLTQYDEHRGRRLHLYVVRDDMHAYQHLEPKLDGEVWRAAITVPDGGQYRLYAEFVPRVSVETVHPILLGVPFVVPGDTTFEPLPEPAASVTVDGVTVTRVGGIAQPKVGRESTLRFTLPGATLPGASGGSLTVLHATSLAMLDVRSAKAKDGGLAFTTRFAERGEHRLFVEFQVDGKRRIAGFTVFAT
ncbi:MAG: hypothetical protein ACRDTM_10045 [Micromonosporaceae bacterium]